MTATLYAMEYSNSANNSESGERLESVEVATGPDEERGESRGHATAIVAIGDVATGVLAMGSTRTDRTRPWPAIVEP